MNDYGQAVKETLAQGLKSGVREDIDPFSERDSKK
jgi:hypothetical protein